MVFRKSYRYAKAGRDSFEEKERKEGNPDVGNHFKSTANHIISINPSQNAGTDAANIAVTVAIWSTAVLTFAAAIIPIGNAKIKINVAAIKPRNIVVSRRSRINGSTGWLKAMEVPKSPRTALEMNTPY